MASAVSTAPSGAASTPFGPGAGGGRRRKSAAERRAQRRRAEARAASRLLAGLAGLAGHRGGCLSRAGELLRAALAAAQPGVPGRPVSTVRGSPPQAANQGGAARLRGGPGPPWLSGRRGRVPRSRWLLLRSRLPRLRVLLIRGRRWRRRRWRRLEAARRAPARCRARRSSRPRPLRLRLLRPLRRAPACVASSSPSRRAPVLLPPRPPHSAPLSRRMASFASGTGCASQTS